jgi:hypothetical protein
MRCATKYLLEATEITRTSRPIVRGPSMWTYNRQTGNIPVVPAESGFEQVHRGSEFGGLNLLKSPFSWNYSENL